MLRDEILNCFESHRRCKGAEFNEEHFIDYLLENPTRKGSVHNSSEGKKRFFLFWNQVQLEHGICFSFKDREKNYSLNGFLERIQELKNNPKSSKAALRYQMKYSFEWNISIVMNFIFISAVFFTQNWSWVPFVILLIAAYANYKHISFHFRKKRYLRQLWEKIHS